MSRMDSKQDRHRPHASDPKRERHPPTFRDRPLEAIVSILVFGLVGGLIAYACTAVTLS